MRLKSESFGSGDTSWLGSNHGTDNARTSTVVVANFTKATHYPNGHIPSGLPVNAANEADLKPWTGAAGEALGFVLFDQPVADGDATFAVPVVRHGIVRVNKLPVSFTAPTGGVPNFTFVGGA